MLKQHEREMAALLAKFDEQLGPFDKWSDTALNNLEAWAKRLELRRMAGDQDLRCNCDDLRIISDDAASLLTAGT